MLCLLCDCLAAGGAPDKAGALLPAAAQSGLGLQAHARSTLAAHRSSADALQQLQRDDTSLCKARAPAWLASYSVPLSLMRSNSCWTRALVATLAVARQPPLSPWECICYPAHR